jgi:hypothetical protein
VARRRRLVNVMYYCHGCGRRFPVPIAAALEATWQTCPAGHAGAGPDDARFLDAPMPRAKKILAGGLQDPSAPADN